MIENEKIIAACGDLIFRRSVPKKKKSAEDPKTNLWVSLKQRSWEKREKLSEEVDKILHDLGFK